MWDRFIIIKLSTLEKVFINLSWLRYMYTSSWITQAVLHQETSSTCSFFNHSSFTILIKQRCSLPHNFFSRGFHDKIINGGLILSINLNFQFYLSDASLNISLQFANARSIFLCLSLILSTVKPFFSRGSNFRVFRVKWK